MEVTYREGTVKRIRSFGVFSYPGVNPIGIITTSLYSIEVSDFNWVIIGIFEIQFIVILINLH